MSTPRFGGAEVGPAVAAAGRAASAASSLNVPQVRIPQVQAQELDMSSVAGGMMRLGGVLGDRAKEREEYRDAMSASSARDQLMESMMLFEKQDRDTKGPAGSTERMKQHLLNANKQIADSLPSQRAKDKFGMYAKDIELSTMQRTLGLEAQYSLGVKRAQVDQNRTSALTRIQNDPTISGMEKAHTELVEHVDNAVKYGFVSPEEGNNLKDPLAFRVALVEEMTRQGRYEEALGVINKYEDIGDRRLELQVRVQSAMENAKRVDKDMVRKSIGYAIENQNEAQFKMGMAVLSPHILPEEQAELIGKYQSQGIKNTVNTMTKMSSSRQIAMYIDSQKLPENATPEQVRVHDDTIAALRSTLDRRVAMEKDDPARVALEMNPEIVDLRNKWISLPNDNPAKSGAYNEYIDALDVQMRSVLELRGDLPIQPKSELQPIVDIFKSSKSEDAIATLISMKQTSGHRFIPWVRSIAPMLDGDDTRFIVAAELLDTPEEVRLAQEVIKLGAMKMSDIQPDGTLMTHAREKVRHNSDVNTFITNQMNADPTSTWRVKWSGSVQEFISRAAVVGAKDTGDVDRRIKEITKSLITDKMYMQSQPNSDGQYIVPRQYKTSSGWVPVTDNDASGIDMVGTIMMNGLSGSAAEQRRYSPFFFNLQDNKDKINPVYIGDMPVDLDRLGYKSREEFRSALSEKAEMKYKDGKYSFWMKPKGGYGLMQLTRPMVDADGRRSSVPIEYTIEQMLEIDSRYKSVFPRTPLSGGLRK
jgi:hypothetical protein